MAQADAAHSTTAPTSSRTDRLLARLDEHLPLLASDRARRSFLTQQIAAWRARYADFIVTAGRSEPVANPVDPPSAADFLLTITGLEARRDAIRVIHSAVIQHRRPSYDHHVTT